MFNNCLLYIGHISVKAINNSIMFSIYVEQESVSITVGSLVYLDCCSCTSTGEVFCGLKCGAFCYIVDQ